MNRGCRLETAASSPIDFRYHAGEIEIENVQIRSGIVAASMTSWNVRPNAAGGGASAAKLHTLYLSPCPGMILRLGYRLAYPCASSHSGHLLVYPYVCPHTGYLLVYPG